MLGLLGDLEIITGLDISKTLHTATCVSIVTVAVNAITRTLSKMLLISPRLEYSFWKVAPL